MDGRSRIADALVVAAAVALGVFVFSGGVYAGSAGPLRGPALVTGLTAVAVFAALLVAHTRASRQAGRR